ncbi:TPA: hypothetical protein EYN98_30755 [Candidatus Poribacteria bacterium]|nr:hypothetical protein [Candidatus Poribacteria bacterium]HIA70350.1 hypothetical protein [Candidatus Poribacteria bacterium]HIB86612.1 hypothetical protein [Candidatus Poribacteria bacterium]HIN27657.1 hypothetical protein [Candidatus Poribacteria bacterium]
MGNNGYSGWTQTQYGTVVIADYTCGSLLAGKSFIGWRSLLYAPNVVSEVALMGPKVNEEAL